MTFRSSLARSATALAAALAVCAVWTAGSAPRRPGPTARPPTRPTPATPATVTADALPTVQINGVVWSQVVVGNTVYAAGKFTTRPPGRRRRRARNETAREQPAGLRHPHRRPDHLLRARPQRAGAGRRRLPGRLPDLRRRRLHQANGQTRNRIAAFNTATGALVATFRPSVDGQVRAIAATNTTVYVGGDASASAGGAGRATASPRSTPPTGAAAASWAPDRRQRRSTRVAVVTGGGTQVVVGGRFDYAQRRAGHGVGALDAMTGATLPFAVNQLITQPAASTPAITGLDHRRHHRLRHRLRLLRRRRQPRGRLRGRPDGGDRQLGRRLPRRHLLDLRHRRRSSTWPATRTTAATIGGFPQTRTRGDQYHHRAIAFTKAATGHASATDTTARDANFVGQPAPEPAQLVPDLTAGTLHRPGPGRLERRRQQPVRRLRRRVPDGQRRRPAGPGPLRRARDRAEQGRPGRSARARPRRVVVARRRHGPRLAGRRPGTRTTRT